MSNNGSIKVITISRQEAINQLQQDITLFERRYECSSDFMVAAVENGHMKETAEIGVWMNKCRVLARLEGCDRRGLMTGIYRARV